MVHLAAACLLEIAPTIYSPLGPAQGWSWLLYPLRTLPIRIVSELKLVCA